jgi:hypothetical protein
MIYNVAGAGSAGFPRGGAGVGFFECPLLYRASRELWGSLFGIERCGPALAGPLAAPGCATSPIPRAVATIMILHCHTPANGLAQWTAKAGTANLFKSFFIWIHPFAVLDLSSEARKVPDDHRGLGRVRVSNAHVAEETPVWTKRVVDRGARVGTAVRSIGVRCGIGVVTISRQSSEIGAVGSVQSWR